MSVFRKVLIAAVVGGVGYLLYKSYKKEVKKIEAEEKRVEEDLVSIGVVKDDIEDDLEPGEDDLNLPKALYSTMRNNDDPELNEAIETEEALNETHVVRIVQEKSGANGDWLKLMFQVPTEKYCSNSPEIGDYINAFKQEMNYIKDEILRIVPNPFMRLEGYYVLLYVSDEGEDESKKCFGVKHIQIPREDYEQYASKNRDGLSDYVADLMNNDMEKLHKLSKQRGVPYSEAILLFTIGFPIGFTRRDGMGFGLKSTFETLCHIKDELVVVNGRLNRDLALKSGVRYEKFLFHVIGEGLDRYYDYSSKMGRILDYPILIDEEEYPPNTILK